MVRQGQKIARMGHTGTGIDRERSHVHLEINLMLNTGFDHLVAVADPGDPNKHGNYNGLNLSGFDVARFYLALRDHPDLTIPDFFAQEEVYFRALVPAGAQPPDLLRLYPWLGNSPVTAGKPIAAGTPAPAAATQPAAWEISFTRAGLPLRVLPSPTVVKAPVLAFVQPSTVPYWEMTHRLIYGAGALATLSPYGQRLVSLIGHTDPTPGAPTVGAPPPAAGQPPHAH